MPRNDFLYMELQRRKAWSVEWKYGRKITVWQNSILTKCQDLQPKIRWRKRKDFIGIFYQINQQEK